MLHVGVMEGRESSVVATSLLSLGAVRASTGSDAPDEPVVWLHDGSGRSPHCLHLVIATSPAPTDDADIWLDATLSPAALDAAVRDLWHGRIAPFEANLRTSKRAPRRQLPALAAPDARWPGNAARLIDRLAVTVGDEVLRIDHIGSTSVPGLPAKDLIDIQVTVTDLSVARSAAERARLAGFVHVPGSWTGMDRFGVEHPEEVAVDADPGRPTNVNFRPVTAPVWRATLLFRDWLRTDDSERDAYAAMKLGLTGAPANVDDYGEAKMPWIHDALARAETWAERVDWTPPALSGGS